MISKRFIIMFTGRCGGTFLQRSLDQHSQIICDKEVLSTHKLNMDKQIEYMNNFFLKNKDYVSGFKNKLEFISDYSRFRDYLIDNKFKIIHLFRDNMIKQALSCYTGDLLRQRIGKYHLYPNQIEHKINKIMLNFENFKQCLMWTIEQDRRMFKFLSTIPHVKRIRYEDLNNDPDSVIREVQEILGVNYESVKDKMIKLMPDDLSEVIENYDDFREMMKKLTSSCGVFEDRILFKGYY